MHIPALPSVIRRVSTVPLTFSALVLVYQGKDLEVAWSFLPRWLPARSRERSHHPSAVTLPCAGVALACRPHCRRIAQHVHGGVAMRQMLTAP